MDEKMTRMQWKRIMRLIFGTGAILIVLIVILIICLARTIDISTKNQMTVESGEYKNWIYKQIDADFQNLNTLGSFFSRDMLKDKDSLAEKLYKGNEQNQFLTMAFFYPDGSGIISTLEKGVDQNADYRTLNEEAQGIVKKALKGEQSVSRLFQSSAVDERVFVYAVPVYIEGKVAGALAASDQIEIFSEILNGNTILGGNGYMHMIGTEGDFLIRSAESVVKEQISNIFDGPYFEEEEVKMLKKEMKKQKKVFSSFRYENKRYQVLLEPVGMNGWYLMCVNTQQGSNQYAYQILEITGLAFIGLLLIVIFLLAYGVHFVQRNNKELRYQAYHDLLTGAKNLLYFNWELENNLKHNTGCSVIALNIQKFKFINEIFGREYGDRLLTEIRKILDRKMEKGEFFARDKADLFYICLLETEKERILSRLQDIMNEIVNISNNHHNNYQILLYCGVVLSEENANREDIMTHVMFALATAKGSYQNNVWFYDSQLHEKEKTENYVESHMRQGLKDGEFKMYLQPKIELKTGRLTGAEALVRWVKQDGSMIYPDEFISLFEKNGFCTQLDMYMAECACKQIRRWIDDGIEPVGISVNQSKLLFYESGYIGAMTKLIKKYRIPGNLITLEILEGLAAENVEELNDKIALLQEQGFRVSLDDFGSGYSSLNILGSLQVDELKLDRGFLMEVADGKNKRLRMIMEEIVRLTKRLEIITVVEGVETLENEELCREIGCDLGQGYYYSRPLDKDEFNKKYMKKE